MDDSSEKRAEMRKRTTQQAFKSTSPLLQQLEKAFGHARTGSYRTRDRYKGSAEQFATFCTEKFKLQNWKNVKDKHVAAFIKERQESGIAPTTIKNDLSAIRYMIDLIPQTRTRLSDNNALQEKFEIELKPTRVSNGDRSWTKEEFQSALEWAHNRGEIKFYDALILAREMGLRVSEVVCARRSQAEQALRKGIYHIQGEAKGGRHREVPINESARKSLERLAASTPRGGRLFIQNNEKAESVRNRFEKCMEKMRETITTKEGQERRTYEKDHISITNELTWHGLRYSYAQHRIEDLTELNMRSGFERHTASEIAIGQLTQELGHNRHDVVHIYICQ